jgi:hypothetical protein
MRRAIYIVAVAALIIVGMWIVADAAQAATTEQAVYDMLREFGSPLAEESFTLVAFRRAQGPDFSIIDFLALTWAESSMGMGALRHHNVGSIKGGPVGTLWRDLRTGTFGSGYNEYASFRDGQRAALLLVMQRYGGSVLRTGLLRWYGSGVPGWSHYSGNVYAAKRLLIAAGRRHGLAEVHLH